MRILITPRSFGKHNPEIFDYLRGCGLELTLNESGGLLPPEKMASLLAPCEGLILGLEPLTEELLCAAPRLRAVARYGVGLDTVNVAACQARGIALSRTIGANSEAVADYAFTLMLMLARRAAVIHARCQKGNWGKLISLDIYGKTLGLVGLGAVGRAMAPRALGFGMRLLAHDVAFDEAFAKKHKVARASLDEICRTADVISLHCPLNESSRHCINAARIAAMKPTAILVNTARGELVDEAALLSALQAGRIYGAGLDVFAQEPPENPAWYTLENCVMGAHCAASTTGATSLMARMAADNLLRDLGLA